MVSISEKRLEYENSRPFDYNRWSTYQEVNNLVNALVADMAKRQAGRYRLNMKVIVLDLYHSYLADPEQYIGFHRGSDYFKFTVEATKRKCHGKNPHITQEAFVGCVDYLIGQQYISYVEGKQFRHDDPKKQQGYLSRMRPTSKFAELISQYAVTPLMIGGFSEEKVIVLKGKKPKKLKGQKTKPKAKEIFRYKKTIEVKHMTQVVREYNNLLKRSYIDIDVECITAEDRQEFIRDMIDRKDKKFEKICLGSKRVYRVFNEGSFEMGGRFYGAWWIGCPSILRPYITINGEPTVELDYSGIHVHLLYAMKGINYADMNDDAYNLVCKLPDKDPDRELNKLILLTAFNAKGEGLTASSVFNQLRRNKELQKHRIQDHDPIHAKLELLKKKHPLIEEYISQGYGLKLQYYDSCVIEKLISRTVKADITILTIHDSVICQRKHVDYIQDVMWYDYSEFIKAQFGIDIRYQRAYPHKARAISYLVNLSKYRVFKNSSISTDQAGALKLDITKYTNSKLIKFKNSIIDIKPDMRANTCTGRCKYANRVKAYKAKEYINLGNVLMKLEHKDDSYKLVIK